MEAKVTKLTLGQVLPNPFQPEGRIEIDEQTRATFGISIKQHGLIQLPVVRKAEGEKYEMADGWLRYNGYKWLRDNGATGFSEIPVRVIELTDQQMADFILQANVTRKDLSEIDKAKLYKQYIEKFSVTQAELAKLHNISQGEIANTIRLLDLPGYVQKKIISQEITPTHGRSLLQLNNDHVDDLLNLSDEISKEGLTVATLEVKIREVLGKPAKQINNPINAPAKTEALSIENKPQQSAVTNPIPEQEEPANEPAGAENDDCEEQETVEPLTTHQAGNNQQAAPLAKMPTPIAKIPERKLIMNEVDGWVTISIMYPSSFMFIKKIAGTLETTMVNMPGYMREANAKQEETLK